MAGKQNTKDLELTEKVFVDKAEIVLTITADKLKEHKPHACMCCEKEVKE